MTKVNGATCRILQINTKNIGRIMPDAYTYKKEKNRSNDDKGGYRHKNRETQIDNEKQDPLQFMSV